MKVEENVANGLIQLIDKKSSDIVNKADKKYLKYKNATVTSYDETTSLATVKFSDIDKEYNLYNKTGEILAEYDSVKVEYTNNLSQGIITVKYGVWVKEKDEEDDISGDTPLTEYKYISDLSVKFNGTTYTIEKDETTGLISKISADNGGEFKPTDESGGTISDVALHNAVFWAVTMQQ